MTGLKSLVMMQLKNKLDLSFAGRAKQTFFKIVFAILKFAIITAVIFFAFTFISSLRLTSLNAGIPTNFFSIIFSIMVVLSIIVCMVGLTKNLYLSKDNQVLLTMPTSRQTVFFSKMIVFSIYEFIKNIFYIMPVLVAYGLVNGLPIYFYFWLIVVNLVVTLFTTTVGALLSIPFLFCSLFVKKNKILEIILTSIVVAAVLVLVILLISAIPKNIDILGNWSTIFWGIQDVFTNYITNFYPIYCFTIAFTGYRYGLSNVLFSGTQIVSLLIVIGIILLLIVATYFLIKPLFFKMASKPFEFTKKSNLKKLKNKKCSAFVGSAKKEFLMAYRTSGRFNSLIIIALLMPLAILLLNKIFGAMDTRLDGTFMTMAFNVLLILLISLSSNAIVSKLYSEEGLSSFINKIVPVTYPKVLFSKLLIFLALMNLSVLASTIIFGCFAKFSLLQIIIMAVSLCAIYMGHMFWSASLDVMNPQTESYATTGTHVNNPNETKSTVFAFLISALVTFIFFFLVSENLATVWIKIGVLALVYLAWNVFMYLSKVKVYFKER